MEEVKSMLLRVVTWTQQKLLIDQEMILSYLEDGKYNTHHISSAWIDKAYDPIDKRIYENEYPPSVIFGGQRYWVAKQRGTIFC